jgi:hypothetical protein
MLANGIIHNAYRSIDPRDIMDAFRFLDAYGCPKCAGASSECAHALLASVADARPILDTYPCGA